MKDDAFYSKQSLALLENKRLAYQKGRVTGCPAGVSLCCPVYSTFLRRQPLICSTNFILIEVHYYATPCPAKIIENSKCKYNTDDDPKVGK